MNALRIAMAVGVCCAVGACSSSSSGTTGSTGSTTGGTTSSGTGSGTTSGSGATGTTSGTSGGPTAQAACAAYATATCTLLSTCSGSSEFLLKRTYGSVTACEAAVTSNCVDDLAAPQNATTPSHMIACATAVGSESCDDYFDNNVPSACYPGVGPLATGASCIASGQCKSQFCAVPANALCGTCQAMPKAGDACDTISCGYQGLICSSETSLCVAPIPDGGTCNDPSVCVAGFDCLGLDAGGAPGICQPKATRPGDVCDPKHFTATTCYNHLGLFCSEKICQKLQLADAGADCGEIDAGPLACPTGDTSCIVEQQIDCYAGGACVETGGAATCVAPTTAGGTCDLNAGPLCAPGQGTCDVTTGTTGICANATAAACN